MRQNIGKSSVLFLVGFLIFNSQLSHAIVAQIPGKTQIAEKAQPGEPLECATERNDHFGKP